MPQPNSLDSSRPNATPVGAPPSSLITRTVGGETRKWREDDGTWVPLEAGDTKTIGGVTGQWDGQTWRRTADAPPRAARTPLDTLSDFVSGAVSTSPLNPMNIVRAVAHPIDTVGRAIVDPLDELSQFIGHAKNAITNPGNEGFLGRASEGVQAIEHLGGAVPLIGKAGVHAGETIGRGDIARGTGELAGLASSALVPDVAEGAPRVMSATGRGMEKVGTAIGDSRLGGYGIPGLAVAEAVLRSDPKGLALAAAPTVLKYGGRGLQRAGAALGAVPASLEALHGADQYVDVARRAPRSTEVPGFSYREPAQTVSEPLPQPSLDRYMSNASGYVPGAASPAVDAPMMSPPSPAMGVSPSLRALARNDELWGPSSVTKTGDVSQADESGRLLYDPQTPTEYIREQLSRETDPAQRAYLAKVLRQRYNVTARPRLQQ